MLGLIGGGVCGSGVVGTAVGDSEDAGQYSVLGGGQTAFRAVLGGAEQGDGGARLSAGVCLLGHAAQDVRADAGSVGFVRGAQADEVVALRGAVGAGVVTGPTGKPGQFRGDGVQAAA